MGWLDQRRVRRVSGYPAEVVQAFDFFVWSALDDMNLMPTEPRPFGDDERYYNSLLNAYLFPREVRRGEIKGNTTEMWSRSPLAASYMPYYFPDDFSYESRERALSVAKHAHLLALVSGRVERLKEAAKASAPLSESPNYNFTCLIRPDGYLAFYDGLRDRGKRFATASESEREQAAETAIKAALLPRSVTVENGNEWYACSPRIAEQLVPDLIEITHAS